jgi:hypothetical protein
METVKDETKDPSGTVRAAWQVTSDPDTKGPCILSRTKVQNGPRPSAMAYRIRGLPMWIERRSHYVPIIVFEPGRIDVDADESVKPRREQSRTDECAAWLKERLAAGPILSSAIFEEGAPKGLSWDVCYTAKKRLQAKGIKAVFQGTSVRSLPDKKEHTSDRE